MDKAAVVKSLSCNKKVISLTHLMNLNSLTVADCDTLEWCNTASLNIVHTHCACLVLATRSVIVWHDCIFGEKVKTWGTPFCQTKARSACDPDGGHKPKHTGLCVYVRDALNPFQWIVDTDLIKLIGYQPVMTNTHLLQFSALLLSFAVS